MSFIIKVLVQMPDGSFQRLPVAGKTEQGFQVVKQPSKKEAKYWAQFNLPDKLQIDEDELSEESKEATSKLREEGPGSSQ